MSAPGTMPDLEERAQYRMVTPQATLSVVRMALAVLADRCLLWASFLGSFALFGYAVYEPTWLREIVASTYTLLVVTPQILRGWKER